MTDPFLDGAPLQTHLAFFVPQSLSTYVHNKGNMLEFGTLPDEDKREHIELLIELLEKQRIMYTRLSLSDDPTAKELLENLKKSVQLLGFPPNTSVQTLFDTMKETIDNLKKQVDIL